MKASAFVLAFVCFISSGALSQHAGSATRMDRAMQGMRDIPNAYPLPGLSIYNLNGHWTTQDGVTEPLSALRGKSLVAAMIFTHCRDVCPLIAERMQEVERALPTADRDSVRFVLFSLDWVRDNPDGLRRFASQHDLDTHRWTLFHGSENAVRELAATLGVSFYRAANGDFQHSIAIFAIDADGVVNFEQADLEQPATRITVAVRRLLRKEHQKPVQTQ